MIEVEFAALVVLLGFALGAAVEHARHEGDWMRGFLAGMADMRARYVRVGGRMEVPDEPQRRQMAGFDRALARRGIVGRDDVSAAGRQRDPAGGGGPDPLTLDR